MKNRRTIFLIFGFIMLFNAIFINGAYIVSGKFPEGLLAFAFTIMTFCLAYLAPHLAEKDERAQRIRERAIYSSYFWGNGFCGYVNDTLQPYINFKSCYLSRIIPFRGILYIYRLFKHGLLCKKILNVLLKWDQSINTGTIL